MTDKQQYEVWKPLDDIPETAYVISLLDTVEGLMITLGVDTSLIPPNRKKDAQISVFFDWYYVYRSIDEGDIYVNIGNMSCYKSLPQLFLKSTSSDYIKWFQKESGGKHEDENIVHYRILTDDDIIDVLSVEEPIVKWIE